MLRAKLSTVNGALRSFSNASNADLSRSSSASSGGTHRLNSAPHPRVRVARAPAAAVREGESPEFGIDAHPSASLPGTVPRRAMAEWRVVCSCGWTREASSAWAAKSMSRLHERIGLPEVKHAARVEFLDGPESGSQLPVI